MSKTVKRVESAPMVGPRHRAQPPAAVGGGGGEEILFSIASVDCEADPKSAVLDILSRDCGKSTVTGEEDQQVTAYDMVGCNLNEPEADLIGRKGYARYMKGVGVYDECEWEIKFICCAESSCD